MEFASLFSGFGGLDLGLERAGHECVVQVEINDYARRVLAKHWPDVPRLSDVHDITAADGHGAEMLAGGFPCQPISVAGKGLVQDDERWLWPAFERAIRTLRPRVVVVENVPAIASGRGLSIVIGDLAALGFDAEWGIVSACAVGAPHTRKRLFVIAHDGCLRLEGHSPQTLRRFPEFSWCKDVRGVADFFGRPDIPRPLFRGSRDGVPDWVERLRGLGNAVVPAVGQVIGDLVNEMTPQSGE